MRVLLTLLTALASSPSALAGSALLQNDGFTDGSYVAFEQGFIANECWASVFVPDRSWYPLTLNYVDMLVGPNDEDLFTFQVMNVSGSNQPSSTRGSEYVYLYGATDSMNRVTIADLELDTSAITYESGNIGIAVCTPDEWTGAINAPAIARDTDGLSHADRSWIYASGGWYYASLFGVMGDWIMRLCVRSDAISGDACAESDTDTDADSDTDTDADADTDTDADSDADADPGVLTLTSITPSTCSVGESIDVVLLGTGFSEGVQAHIGGLSITGLARVNGETLQGETPTALPVGVHDVDVVLLSGDNAVLSGAFIVEGADDTGTGKDEGCGCSGLALRGGGAFAWGLAGLLALRRRRRA
jgi:hypothetical protein